jgi:hypothetical protein
MPPSLGSLFALHQVGHSRVTFARIPPVTHPSRLLCVFSQHQKGRIGGLDVHPSSCSYPILSRSGQTIPSPTKPPHPRMTGYMPLGWSQQHQSTFAKIALLAASILIVGYITLSSLTRTSPRTSLDDTDTPPSNLGLGSLLSTNRQLTRSQCAAVYPLLYKEADRAREWHAGRGGVTLEDVEAAEKDGNARVAIIDQKVTYPPLARPPAHVLMYTHDTRPYLQLYIKSYNKDWNSRTPAVLAALQQTVLTSPEPLPDVEWVVCPRPAVLDGGTMAQRPHLFTARQVCHSGIRRRVWNRSVVCAGS